MYYTPFINKFRAPLCMLLITKISDLRSCLSQVSYSGKSRGLVPTMGALHDGHISLISRSVSQNDITVCSIFVNPIQFNNATDLERYPRTLEQDCALLEKSGCDIVFAPSAEEMYKRSPELTMGFGALETVMEGAFRPGHFSGVGIVVSKLFNIVQPDKAYFGQKDFQQLAVIKQMVRDLSFPVEIVSCPILRDPDGLAMSSRNTRLSAEERVSAPQIYRVISDAANLLRKDQDADQTRRFVTEQFAALPQFQLEYFEIADADTLQPVNNYDAFSATVLCIAAYLGGIRLIDNILI